MPQDGNYHQYNHKVLYTTIIKDKQGGYSYKMGINCYQLDKDKDYTLCIEILNSDYQLWHKSVATIDKTTSKGVSVAGFTVQKFSHRYTNSSGNTAYMYYIKIIVNFLKTVASLYSLDLYVNIPQAGIDLNTYPKNWTNNWMIAYGVFGKVSSIDLQKTYDYHTVFYIKPTEVVYNVDLDMNRKKILNIDPDKTRATWVFSKLQGFLYYFPENFRCSFTYYESVSFLHHIFESENLRFPVFDESNLTWGMKCKKLIFRKS